MLLLHFLFSLAPKRYVAKQAGSDDSSDAISDYQERLALTQDVTSAVLAAEKRRCDAMVANDGAVLDQLLDPSLYFSHATGFVDDKAAYLGKLAAAKIVYAAIAWSEEKVTELGPDVAMLTGRMATDVCVGGADKQLSNRTMTIWRNGDGGWRLVAFQSTPLVG